jgi:hypothetical protein
VHIQLDLRKSHRVGMVRRICYLIHRARGRWQIVAAVLIAAASSFSDPALARSPSAFAIASLATAPATRVHVLPPGALEFLVDSWDMRPLGSRSAWLGIDKSALGLSGLPSPGRELATLCAAIVRNGSMPGPTREAAIDVAEWDFGRGLATPGVLERMEVSAAAQDSERPSRTGQERQASACAGANPRQVRAGALRDSDSLELRTDQFGGDTHELLPQH